jgi:hypothetical protein
LSFFILIKYYFFTKSQYNPHEWQIEERGEIREIFYVKIRDKKAIRKLFRFPMYWYATSGLGNL